ncbi:MAG: DEAD/DEAH box helicase, partial [Acetobacterales bacterium]
MAVRLPLPVPTPFDYATGEFDPSALPAGAYAVVPFGKRRAVGVVWGAATGQVAPEKLKPLAALSDLPPMPAELRAFVEWVADYTLSPVGSVLRMAISVPAAFEPPAPATGWRRAAADPAASGLRWTPGRRRVWDVAEGPARGAAELARQAGTGTSVVKGLAAAGLLEAVALPPIRFRVPDPSLPGPALSDAQRDAAGSLCRMVEDAAAAREPGPPALLDGVTGSGKTEGYFEAIAEALRQGRQALVLLPEIALTAQWLGRFETRFGCRPAQWHSDLTGAQRRATWRAVALG